MRHRKPLLRTFQNVWVGVTITFAVLFTVPIVGFPEIRSSDARANGTANARVNSSRGMRSGRADRSTSDPTDKVGVSQAYGQLPLSFEANRGQTDRRVKFLSR